MAQKPIIPIPGAIVETPVTVTIKAVVRTAGAQDPDVLRASVLTHISFAAPFAATIHDVKVETGVQGVQGIVK